MTETTDRLTELRELFIAKRGYWNDSWQFILDRDPDFFEGYLHMSSHAWENGTLSPKLKEFIYIVTVASVTHIFPPGLHQHMRNAIELGATEAELLTVLQIASTVGIQTFLLGVSSIEDVRPGATRGAGNGTPVDDVLARHRRCSGPRPATCRRPRPPIRPSTSAGWTWRPCRSPSPTCWRPRTRT